MKKVLFLLLVTSISYGQALFDKGVKITGGQPSNTTPAFITTTAVNGLQEKIPSAYIEKTANKQNSLAVDGTGAKFPTVDGVNEGFALKANDTDVVHKTEVETITGNKYFTGSSYGFGTTTPIGRLGISTGLSGNTIDIVNQQNGSISFSNAGASTAAPTITGKSNDAPGLLTLSANNNINPLYDMGFQVSENDNTDFSTLTSVAYTFRRHSTSLIDILRNGNTTFAGQIKGANFLTDAGDYVNGAKTKTAIASFYNSKTITTHADYGFLENSDLNYAGIALQAHASFNDNINIIGVQNSDHHHSYQAYPHYGNTGILGNMKGFWMQPDVTAGTVINLYEFEANNPLGSGTITNLVGLRIRELTRGSSSNYAIFTEGATPSFLSGNTYFGSKVGIGGTITPAANLEVLDINRVTASAGGVTIRSTDSAAIDKGGYLTLGGSFNTLNRTSFAGIAGRKENATNNNVAGYLSFTTSSPSLGLTERMRISSTGGVSIGNTTDLGVGTLNVSGNITAPAGTTANHVVNKSQLDAIKPYKVYTALLTQTGTNAPTATVLENTLGGTVVWTRNGIGSYLATLTGAFNISKTAFTSTNNAYASANPVYYQASCLDNNQSRIITSIGTTPTDGIIGGLLFEIRVYN